MLVVSSLDLNATDTIECGQFFRYQIIGLNKYRVFSLNKSALLYTNFDKTFIESNDENYFKNFFDLDFNVDEVLKFLSNFEELRDPLKKCHGLRILKQDLFETIVSFIISANNNIPRISKIINNLCVAKGEKINDYYSFPTLEALLTLTDEDFKKLGTGYRSSYLVSSLKHLKSTNLLKTIPYLSTDKAREELMKLSGVGYKVADCILLYGLHRLEVYPVDSIIFKHSKTKFRSNLAAVRNYYLTRYGKFGGYAQQYFYHYNRNINNKNIKKEINSSNVN